MITNNNSKDIKILLKEKSLIHYFNDIIFGKFDDGELHNFLITNDTIKNTFFIVSESNDESSISSFIKNNIISNNLIKNFIDIPDKLNEKDVIFNPTNYSILVLNIIKKDNGIEINTLGIFEWILSNILYNKNINSLEDSLKILNDKNFNLYAMNYEDISNNFIDIISDENLQEILTQENI